MTSDGETTNIKVVDIEKLCNFVVDNFSIGIRLYKGVCTSSSSQKVSGFRPCLNRR